MTHVAQLSPICHNGHCRYSAPKNRHLCRFVFLAGGRVMDLAEALAQTATERGPQSNLERLLDGVTPEQRTEIENALKSDIEAMHLQRALTKLAKHHGILTGDKAAVSVESIKKWRGRS